MANLPAEAAVLERLLAAAWGAVPAGDAVPEALIARLVGEKYGRDDWLGRR